MSPDGVKGLLEVGPTDDAGVLVSGVADPGVTVGLTSFDVGSESAAGPIENFGDFFGRVDVPSVAPDDEVGLDADDFLDGEVERCGVTTS